MDDYRLPKKETERAALAALIGADGFELLQAVYALEAPGWLREMPAVEILRRVWLQQYYAAEAGPIRWRSSADTPPAHLLINSPYDPEARYAGKRDRTWVGYKAHLTETCEPDQPQVVTHAQTTPATTHDGQVVEAIHADLAHKHLLPSEHLVDTGYTDSDLLVSSRTHYGVELLGPVMGDTSWQARETTGFDLSAFTVDWAARTVTCPEGHTSVKWCPTHDRHGNDVIHIEFATADCRSCPSRPRCTRSAKEPREMGLRPQEQQEALRAARRTRAARPALPSRCFTRWVTSFPGANRPGPCSTNARPCPPTAVPLPPPSPTRPKESARRSTAPPRSRHSLLPTSPPPYAPSDPSGSLAQGAKELAHIDDDEVRCFHRREVHAA